MGFPDAVKPVEVQKRRYGATAKLIPGTLRNDVLVRDSFILETDEPESVGGENTAPAPHELLGAALASCVTTTMAMYARTKGWELGDVLVEVDYDQDVTPRRFRVDVFLEGDYDAGRIARLEPRRRDVPRPPLSRGRVRHRGARARLARGRGPVAAPETAENSAAPRV